MKQILLVFVCFLQINAAFSQNKLFLELKQRLGNGPFSFISPVQGSGGNYQYKISRLDYYISEIQIIHDGGQITPIANKWLLIKMPKDSLFNLGAVPGIQTVEGVRFSIGVDTAHNHLDPATYPAAHPLAPQNPDMHWGWSWGYRFLCIEGKLSPDYTNIFEIHTVGDMNYQTIDPIYTGADLLPNGDRVIRLKANYAGILDGIDVSDGPIAHSPIGIAAVAMQNIRTKVFSSITTSADAPAFTGRFEVYPNPTALPNAQVHFDLPADARFEVVISDVQGRQVATRALASGSGQQMLELPNAKGAYWVHLLRNGQAVARRTLLVHP
jgi:hypothetical protein